ncbi:CAP domain-containing protein [Sinorhizobium fredii]|uniref:CAP domain-containing protein n=1 Tax=Rhizobium fredii TaxID=380 RepID=UPI0012FD2724
MVWLTYASALNSGHGLIVAGILLLLSFCPSALAAETGELNQLRAQALSLVNDARKRHGLNPLRATERLNSAAQSHAGDMLERKYYSHRSPEGERLSAIATAIAVEAAGKWSQRTLHAAPVARRCLPPTAFRISRKDG